MTIIVEEGENNFSAYSPDFPGCVAAGYTIRGVLTLMGEAIAQHIEGMKEDDRECT